MENRALPIFNEQIHQAACEWFVDFRTGAPTEDARKAFYAWLQESPAHVSAYIEVTAIWIEGAGLDRKERWTIEALIAQAADDGENIVPHPATLPQSLSAMAYESGRDATNPRNPQRRKARLLKDAIAACLLLACGAVGLYAWMDRVPRYVTGVGEQRFIALPDGSSVSLNSRSKIRVRYSAHERGIELLEGQALFGVTKDPRRPFVVSSDSVKVRAVGTQFDVYRKPSGIVVTVVEGRVSVQARSRTSEWKPQRPGPDADPDSRPMPAGNKGAVFLAAGEQVRVAPNVVPHPVPVDIESATAWTHRRLVFESTPLAEVVEEFNRYNNRPIVIRYPQLDTFEIDGVFSSTDPAALIRFLRERHGVQVTETESLIVISSR